MVHINRAAMYQRVQAWLIGPDAWGPLIYWDDEWNSLCNF